MLRFSLEMARMEWNIRWDIFGDKVTKTRLRCFGHRERIVNILADRCSDGITRHKAKMKTEEVIYRCGEQSWCEGRTCKE